MYFNFRGFFRVAYLSFFKWTTTRTPLTLRRVLFLLVFFTIFPIVQIFNAICLLLDEILFPGYRKVNVRSPIFIVGNGRSGTTFIHRLMSKNENMFFCFKTWEIIFPAIIQKKIVSWFGQIDRLMGSIFSKLIKNIESRLFADFNKLHKVSLFSPEEDDKVFMHSFAHLDLLWFFPFFDEFYWLQNFDGVAPPDDRKRMMTFYKNCIKRQAYYKNHSGHLLSKGPFASAKVGSLLEYFPGCKIIYMIRNPFEVIPSAINFAHEIWSSTLNIDVDYRFRERVYEGVLHYYNYPLERLQGEAPGAYAIIKYDDLIAQPALVVQMACRKVGIEADAGFINMLQEEERKATRYRSDHVYSLEKVQISKEQVAVDLGNILKRFGFEVPC
jgi:hypothetical protein